MLEKLCGLVGLFEHGNVYPYQPGPAGSKNVYIRCFMFDTQRFVDWTLFGELSGPAKVTIDPKYTLPVYRDIADGIERAMKDGLTAGGLAFAPNQPIDPPLPNWFQYEPVVIDFMVTDECPKVFTEEEKLKLIWIGIDSATKVGIL